MYPTAPQGVKQHKVSQRLNTTKFLWYKVSQMFKYEKLVKESAIASLDVVQSNSAINNYFKIGLSFCNFKTKAV